MNNNKRKNPKVNTCGKCGQSTIVFIHTTSRQVNPGIKVMYPNDKICLKCYNAMSKVYPPVRLNND